MRQERTFLPAGARYRQTAANGRRHRRRNSAVVQLGGVGGSVGRRLWFCTPWRAGCGQARHPGQGLVVERLQWHCTAVACSVCRDDVAVGRAKAPVHAWRDRILYSQGLLCVHQAPRWQELQCDATLWLQRASCVGLERAIVNYAQRCVRSSNMQAVQVVRLADPTHGALQLATLPVPTQLSDGQILIRVTATSINFADVLQAQGLYQERPALPFIPCSECSGTVVAVGHKVEAVKPGDKVPPPHRSHLCCHTLLPC